jgi:hypothetical protein
MQIVESNCSDLPEVEYQPRVVNAPSRLNCRFGWGDETTQEFSSRDFEELLLKGGKKHDFHIPDLGEKAIEIKQLVMGAPGHVDGIAQFSHLQSIEIEFLPKNGLDLSIFKHLVSVFSDRNKPIEKQLGQLTELKALGLIGYSGVDCSEFAALSNLEAIALTQGRLQKLDGLEKCRKLTDVSLAYLRELTDVVALENLSGLTDISLTSLSKVAGTFTVSKYEKLQSLYIMSCDLSVDLSSLSKNKDLERLVLGVPHKNLDWHELFSLRNLSVISFFVDTFTPGDQELNDLSNQYGHTLEKVERVGPKKKSHLRMHFSS